MLGLFIAFEGIDHCGKSTQLRKTFSWLDGQNRPVVFDAEPTDCNPIGRKIRDILEHREAAPPPFDFQRLFVLDRAQDIICFIQPALEHGQIVLRDRYALSTIAYGMLDRDVNDLIHLHYDVIGRANMLWPDLTILLDISAKTGIKRQRASQQTAQLFEKEQMLVRVRQHYLELAQPGHEVGSEMGKITIINGEQTEEKVFADIKETVNESLSRLQYD